MPEVIELVPPEQYVGARSQLFPSETSFNWFVRRNREELAQAGALLKPAGRWLVQPQAFDQAVLAIGARRAKSAP